MERQIWQHNESGCRYIVDLDGDCIVAAIGPVHHGEIESLWQDGYEPDRGLQDDLDADRERCVAVRTGGPVRYISSVLDPSVKEVDSCS